jgi:hypothetical protein
MSDVFEDNEFGIPILSERNVANVPEMDKYVLSFEVTDQKILQWLKSNLRKYLISDYEETKDYTAKSTDPDWMKKNDIITVHPTKDFTDQIRHVLDYFKSKDAPTDLTRISVPDAIKKSDIWLKNLTRGEAEKKVPGEIEVKKYSDGFRWVKLESDQALNREGKLMGHCVGSYCQQVSEEGVEIYSLRDEKNDPHCTIEVSSDKEIQQIKGKQNKEVVSKYHKYVQDFVDAMGFEVGSGGEGDLSKAGLINIDGKRYQVGSPESWPKDIKGDLNLSDTPITSLPDNLSVKGDLDLRDTKITSLPDNLSVGGDLDLRGTPITSLPDNLSVGGDLDLRGTPITSLPDNLSVGGYLNLSYTPITSLPDNLSVGGDLYLSNTPITSLPDNLSVGGGLYLSNTPITSLPDNLSVKGYLSLSRTPLSKKWKDSMKPKGVKGKVIL